MSDTVPDLKLIAESFGWLDGEHPPHRYPRKGTKQWEWDAEKALAVRLIPKFSNVRPPFAEPPIQEVFFLQTVRLDRVISEG